MNTLRATAGLFRLGYEFVLDSLPSRRRQRFGDIDYDWEYRVDTTSANVGWRSRLLGLLHSPYQPIEPALFREIMDSLAINFAQFTFIDIGSGKGRALLLAAKYPFRRVLGVELLSELHTIAEQNVRKFAETYPHSSPIQNIHADATTFAFPNEPSVILLNNPLPMTNLRIVAANLKGSARSNPRPIILIYANPVWEQVLATTTSFHKIGGTHQYALFQYCG